MLSVKARFGLLILCVFVSIMGTLMVAATVRKSAQRNAERCLEGIAGVLNAGETPPMSSIAVKWQKDSVEDFLASGNRIVWTSPPDLVADFAGTFTYAMGTERGTALGITLIREEGTYKLLSILEDMDATME